MNRGLFIYRAAASLLAHSVLAHPAILAVTVRRSVASGEAVFPWSDLDYDLTVDRDTGAVLASVLRRHRMARALFPRTGQCFVLTAADLPDLAASEPMRASLNRRNLLQVRGPIPDWPAPRISHPEAARRVVFWLMDFFPAAVRHGAVRNQRKFYLEMANALGILEGRWQEPCTTLAAVARAYPVPPDGAIYQGALALAAKASSILGRTPPQLERMHQFGDLQVIPSVDAVPMAFESHPAGMVLTPEALDLLIATQAPACWMDHGRELEAIGFRAPPRQAWIGAARRLASPLWLRGPGFFEPRHGQQEHRLSVARSIVEALAAGRAPNAPPPAAGPVRRSATAYYRHTYDQLRREADTLLAQARQLEAS